MAAGAAAHTRVASLLLAALLAVSPLEADTLELPAEWPLGADSHLVFELDGADLRLTSRVDGLPSLRSRAAVDGEEASLEVTSSGGSLTVRRRAASDTDAVRLRLDVALGPGRTVHITGSDLDVVIEDSLPEDAGRSAYRLVIEGSTVNLTGARISQLEARNSAVVLTATDGALALTLTGGTAQVSGHQGRLELDAAGADVTVVEHAGDLVPRLEGGSLEVAGGAGAFNGNAADAGVSFDDWRGPVDLRAHDSVITVRGAEHRDRWRIDGRALQVNLGGVLGTVDAELAGGFLEAGNLTAAFQLTAAGTRVDLNEVTGGVNLVLTDSAEAVVVGVAGAVEAAVTAARLEIDRVDQLTLNGAGAEVFVHSVGRAERLELLDSQLTLDLRAGRADSVVDLSGSSFADVRLQAPCVVQLGGEASVVNQAQVTGCELRPPGQVVPRRQDRLRYGDSLSLLTVGITTPDSVLEVEGEP